MSVRLCLSPALSVACVFCVFVFCCACLSVPILLGGEFSSEIAALLEASAAVKVEAVLAAVVVPQDAERLDGPSSGNGADGSGDGAGSEMSVTHRSKLERVLGHTMADIAAFQKHSKVFQQLGRTISLLPVIRAYSNNPAASAATDEPTTEPVVAQDTATKAEAEVKTEEETKAETPATPPRPSLAPLSATQVTLRTSSDVLAPVGTQEAPHATQESVGNAAGGERTADELTRAHAATIAQLHADHAATLDGVEATVAELRATSDLVLQQLSVCKVTLAERTAECDDLKAHLATQEVREQQPPPPQ